MADDGYNFQKFSFLWDFFFFLQIISFFSILLYTNWILHHDYLDLYEFYVRIDYISITKYLLL